jgi:hypothetical protein
VLETLLNEGSGGRRVNKEGGVTVVYDCTGLCKLLLDTAFKDAGAFTLGHTIFAKVSELEDITLAHELRHVRQYEALGDAFLPLYFGAGALSLLACQGGDIPDCAHDVNIFEILAGPD